jgi:hypothetical protein
MQGVPYRALVTSAACTGFLQLAGQAVTGCCVWSANYESAQSDAFAIRFRAERRALLVDVVVKPALQPIDPVFQPIELAFQSFDLAVKDNADGAQGNADDDQSGEDREDLHGAHRSVEMR